MNMSRRSSLSTPTISRRDPVRCRCQLLVLWWTTIIRAVNVYYHCDGLFWMMAGMGFQMAPHLARYHVPHHRGSSVLPCRYLRRGRATGMPRATAPGQWDRPSPQVACPVGIGFTFALCCTSSLTQLLYAARQKYWHSAVRAHAGDSSASSCSTRTRRYLIAFRPSRGSPPSGGVTIATSKRDGPRAGGR